jgi:adenosine/AMP kinase
VTAKIKIAVRMTDATRRLYTVDAADMPVEQMAELTRREVPAAHTVLIGLPRPFLSPVDEPPAAA